MPHTRQPPLDPASILATATSDPEWLATLSQSPLPRGFEYGSDPIEAITMMKQVVKATYPQRRAAVSASKPADVTEAEVIVPIPATKLVPTPAKNRVIICHPTLPSSEDRTGNTNGASWPVILLFHGGGHCLGYPEMELPLARLLVQTHQAVVILPSYRLAPEHSFPATFNDGFETLKQIAHDTVNLSANASPSLPSTLNVLPQALTGYIDVNKGFILGGTSAGSTISASISHLYNNHRTTNPHLHLPPLTALFLSCGTCLSPRCVPSTYTPYYLSYEQNKDCPPLDRSFHNMLRAASKADLTSPIMVSLDQQPDLNRPSPATDHTWLKDGHVKVYFQACGQDISRDDTLIYERMLREEVGVETRLDLYAGFGHCFWAIPRIYAEMEMTKARTRHSVEGIGWLLRREVDSQDTEVGSN
ncbi:hypothetical protein H2198_009467 [Neophaeococcomyces mojaviensis]|uniref:Uncharacterized protein n=1 Tax=Neophaeococcomyces mojaviensis TaxID=3383035 RepID=A0ACC2ZUK1_9EURO|nr:hypothetical protein H2198_009467 [Knufia sp. JES_112]